MQRWRFVLLMLGLVGWMPLHVTAAEPNQLLATGINPTLRPAFDGLNVVWGVPNSFDPGLNDLYTASLANRTPILVASAVSRPDLAVDGDWVLWSSVSGYYENATATVFAWNRVQRTPIVVATISGLEQVQVALHGEWAVWNDSTDINKRSLSSLAPAESIAKRIVTQPDLPSFNISEIIIDDSTVVWNEELNYMTPYFLLKTVSINGGTPVTLVSDGPDTVFDMQDGLIVHWTVPFNATSPQLITINTGTTATIPQQNARTNLPAGAPTINGRYVFWSEQWCDFGTACEYFGAWGYDATTQAIFKTPFQPLLARNDGLIWTTLTDGRTDLYGDSLARVLPTAPKSNEPSSFDEPFFIETGHALKKPFGPYWRQHGGLSVFGFPLTEALAQVNRDTGKTLQTQYLERQRFEVHPELAGTPYEISLGRLGDELLIAQGRNWRDEGHEKPGAEQLPGPCETFEVTQRTVCGPFLEYWHSHGLDLGQQGVTSDESLALFGLPLTAPRYELNPDGDRVLTQWFERARFEYHPQNSKPFNVLLGRLGAELIAGYDW